mmetsp:Transcript_785/g.2147  ORF Transcript_785/g.2147 Transcript_785/m.2147 type:complete len:349 (-) Transcript_785:346-1392(-)
MPGAAGAGLQEELRRARLARHRDILSHLQARGGPGPGLPGRRPRRAGRARADGGPGPGARAGLRSGHPQALPAGAAEGRALARHRRPRTQVPPGSPARSLGGVRQEGARVHGHGFRGGAAEHPHRAELQAGDAAVVRQRARRGGAAPDMPAEARARREHGDPLSPGAHGRAGEAGHFAQIQPAPAENVLQRTAQARPGGQVRRVPTARRPEAGRPGGLPHRPRRGDPGPCLQGRNAQGDADAQRRPPREAAHARRLRAGPQGAMPQRCPRRRPRARVPAGEARPDPERRVQEAGDGRSAGRQLKRHYQLRRPHALRQRGQDVLSRRDARRVQGDAVPRDPLERDRIRR